MIEQGPVPYQPRWMVWTAHDIQPNFARPEEATWFWSASGPRGHTSGAEARSDEAVNRAMYAAVLLDTSRRPKEKR